MRNSRRRDMVYNIESINKGNKIIGAIRRGNWKLIKTKYRVLLFDLENDESEKKNLASSRIDIANQLKIMLEKMSSSIVTENKRPIVRDGRNTDKNGYVRSGWCKL